MNYAKIIKYDTSNWAGIQTTLYLSGCTLNCPGCHNKDLQDFNYGNALTYNDIFEKLIKYTSDEHVDGICIMGGEPFDQSLDRLYDIVYSVWKYVKKPIHIWSGYTFEELIKDKRKKKILKYCDTLVDGRFMMNKRDLDLLYRGSANQRVIDLNNSFREGHIIEYSL